MTVDVKVGVKVDVAIIGAGTAALAARAAVLRAKKTALLIDDGPLGTMCARVGCMPSKLLIAAAEVAERARRAKEFGIGVGAIAIDAPAVFARLRRERDAFVAGAVKDTGEVLRERAAFVALDALQAGATRVQANAFVIATGSRPIVPSLFDGLSVLTSDSIFELNEIPRRLAIVGAGALALELGQALQRLGAQVTLYSKDPHLSVLSDERVREAALCALALDIRFNAKITAARKDGGEFVLTVDGVEARSDAILVAVGRQPATADLALDRAGVHALQFDPETLRLGQSRLFIAGDAANDRAMQHEAVDEGRIAGSNAAHFPEVKAHARYLPLSIVFTDPQIAVVGEKFSELSAPRVGEVDFASQGRARVIGQAQGRLRLYADAQGVLRGAEMIAPEAEHLAQALAWLITKKTTARELLALPFYHPTLEESLRTAARQLTR